MGAATSPRSRPDVRPTADAVGRPREMDNPGWLDFDVLEDGPRRSGLFSTLRRLWFALFSATK